MIHYLSGADPKRLRGVALLRLDFNTEDDWRLRATLPTVKFLLHRASKVVIVSHRGRPRGFEKAFSLKADCRNMSRLIGKPIHFVPRPRFSEIKRKIGLAPRGSIFFLENLRFLKGEQENDPHFAKALSSLADFYVNDAFAVSHRANASVAAITKFLPSYAGMELEREVKFLGSVLKKPRHPLAFILGGSKAADKLGIIKHFKNKADHFLLSGVAANTILFLKEMDIKKSLKDENKKDLQKLREILKYKNISLPTDFVWHCDAIVDIGPRTIKTFMEVLGRGRTIIWSGPLGLIEKKPYDKGTLAIARAIVKNRKAFSLAGGGETVMFLKKYKLDKKFSFISTGGGAMLEFLTGKKLPGIEALKHAK